MTTNRKTSEPVAILAAIGLAALAAFQLLLAAGAPLGAAAWGGTHEGRLPTALRVGSALSLLLYAAAAAIVLRRAGFAVPWVSATVARVGIWGLAGLMTVGTMANLASSSAWERFLLAPLTGLIAIGCVVLARSGPAASSRVPAAAPTVRRR